MTGLREAVAAMAERVAMIATDILPTGDALHRHIIPALVMERVSATMASTRKAFTAARNHMEIPSSNTTTKR